MDKLNNEIPMYSSRELLSSIKRVENEINLDKVDEWDEEIGKIMEDFDFEKRRKAAIAIDDLSKLIINA